MSGGLRKTGIRNSLMLMGALATLAGMPSAQASSITYNVTQTYNQAVYNVSHPDWDTVFTGTFVWDDVTHTVSGLSGKLSQAMDGAPTPGASNWIDLTHQLSVVADGTDGLLVTVFKNNATGTFLTTGGPFSGAIDSNGHTFGGNGKMGPVYTNGTQNAFASIYVPLMDPTAALTQTQIDKLAYGDCTPAALMPRNGSGTKCMAGWVAFDSLGNRIPGGTMQGTFPITQTITAAVPEPETYALMMAGLGLMGFVARRRKANPSV